MGTVTKALGEADASNRGGSLDWSALSGSSRALHAIALDRQPSIPKLKVGGLLRK
eukprot:CAMPEP_0182890456 /NCGR_PEP_ID=MMETSP0034_2-20130328/22671_1 /TAXON_ID=156128 /ORGANISM="Nephroselmis pyriformis, Strain CCMP717" /LENGTH=54 /DNA_ID=CAMNT_0025024007 /DNA_START=232 /DNA_END=393 /DNA_ORIENTATION=-